MLHNKFIKLKKKTTDVATDHNAFGENLWRFWTSNFKYVQKMSESTAVIIYNMWWKSDMVDVLISPRGICAIL
jgi:hypothetical protein